MWGRTRQSEKGCMEAEEALSPERNVKEIDFFVFGSSDVSASVQCDLIV